MFGNKEKKKIRFVEDCVESEGGALTSLFTDQETGVQYLFISKSSGLAGVAVLVDENGRPLLDKKIKKDE